MPRVVTPGGGTLASKTIPVTTSETHQVKSDIEFVQLNRSRRAKHNYTKTPDNSNKKKDDSLTSPRARRRKHAASKLARGASKQSSSLLPAPIHGARRRA
jgi:hypothetical protein